MNQAPIFIAITDNNLRTECQHIVAAAGYRIIDSTDPRQMTLHAHRVAAILVDVYTAAHAKSLQTTARIFFISPDGVTPDWQAALTCHAEAAWNIPQQSAQLLQALAVRPNQPQGVILSVFGAAGGVGASTFAAGLAQSLAQETHSPVVLVDIDPYSGGLDLLLGLEEAPGVRWNDLGMDTAGLSGADLLEALPRSSQGVAVLTSHRDAPPQLGHNLIDSVLNALRAVAVVILDYPRSLGTTDLLSSSDIVIVLLPAEIRATAAMLSVLSSIRMQHLQVVAVLCHRQWSGIDPAELEEMLGLELAAEIYTHRSLAKAVELTGLPKRLPRALHRANKQVLTEVGLV